MLKKLCVMGVFCAILLSALILSYADNSAAKAQLDIESSPSTIKEIGIVTGYALSRKALIDKGKYELVPIMVRLGFNLKPLLNKIHINPPGLAEFELEPFANTVIAPDNNAEIGFNILLKYAYPLTKKFYLYAEGGVGAVYMTQHTREQGTQYNFLPQGGAGVMYFLRDNLAVSAGYRFRHLSNSGAEQPNKGINVDMFLTGVSVFY